MFLTQLLTMTSTYKSPSPAIYWHQARDLQQLVYEVGDETAFRFWSLERSSLGRKLLRFDQGLVSELTWLPANHGSFRVSSLTLLLAMSQKFRLKVSFFSTILTYLIIRSSSNRWRSQAP